MFAAFIRETTGKLALGVVAIATAIAGLGMGLLWNPVGWAISEAAELGGFATPATALDLDSAQLRATLATPTAISNDSREQGNVALLIDGPALDGAIAAAFDGRLSPDAAFDTAVALIDKECSRAIEGLGPPELGNKPRVLSLCQRAMSRAEQLRSQITHELGPPASYPSSPVASVPSAPVANPVPDNGKQSDEPTPPVPTSGAPSKPPTGPPVSAPTPTSPPSEAPPETNPDSGDSSPGSGWDGGWETNSIQLGL